MSHLNFTDDKTVEIVSFSLAAIFIILVFAEYLLGRLLNKNYVTAHYLIINLVVASLQQITDLVNKGLFLTAFIFVQTHWSLKQLWGINIVSDSSNALLIAFNFIAVIVIADFCQYWLHRFSHEVNIMWAGHITHHSNEEYNLSVAIRQNALEGIYTWVFFIPLAFLGIPWQLFVLAYSISLLWQFLVHTRFVKRLGFLEYFMATPSHHRVHHGRNPQYIDKNYGAFFIVWDKLFGTFEPEVQEVDYGITKPLENNNPLWSNIHHHISIAKSIRLTKGLHEKLQLLFGGPSVMEKFAPPVSRTSGAFTVQLSKKVYVFINFILCSVVGLWAINYSGGSGEYSLYILASIIVIASYSILVGLLENKPWADKAEIIRLLLLAAGGFALTTATPLALAGLITAGVALTLLASTWLIAYDYHKRFTAS